MKHTPLPWSMSKYCDVVSHGNSVLLTKFTPSRGSRNPEAEANTAFVLRACNSHYELLEALESARKVIASFPRSLGYDITDLPKIDAAIAKAKGET